MKAGPCSIKRLTENIYSGLSRPSSILDTDYAAVAFKHLGFADAPLIETLEGI